MYDTQNIRRSQFVLTYGPGSIIEGKNGSRIIPILRYGLGRYYNEETLKEFEIADIRMSNVLKAGKRGDVRIFSLPSNSALKKPLNYGIYRTYIFPVWQICYGKNKSHKPNFPVIFNSLRTDKKCPLCGETTSTAVRFIAACPDGHLDEVKWNKAVHGDNEQCDTNYFYWKTHGSSLSNIEIQCPVCEESTDMKKVYGNKFKCTGRNPESEQPTTRFGICRTYPDTQYGCGWNMKVTQRQSTSLRIPDTVTLLKIPKYDNRISRILQKKEVSTLIKGYFALNPDENSFITAIENAGFSNETVNEILQEIEKKGYKNFVKFVKELYDEGIEVEDILGEEFETLRGRERCTENFCKGPSIPIKYPDENYEFELKVFPVDKITTVTVQRGYRRSPYIKKDRESKEVIESKLVYSSGARPDGSFWYPGFEGMGEGIFITSEMNPIEALNIQEVAEEWNTKKPKYDSDRWRGDIVKSPLFIWWHTLSHSLIRSLSFFSGYSSASIRERVYVSENSGMGGILLYTTSAGEDCGMGGLVECVNEQKFKEILQMALKSIHLCSNDPLCIRIKVAEDKVNGSACHNCLLVSETSCEHANKWLDRHILIGE